MDVERILAQNRADQQTLITEIEDAADLLRYLQDEEKALSGAVDFLAVRRTADTKRLKARTGRTMGLRPEDVDLTGAETLYEKVRRVAELAPNNEVNITETTDLLLAMNASQEIRTQLRSMVHQRLQRSSEYSQIARGWWVLGQGEPNEDDSDHTGSLLSMRAALQVTDSTDSANAEDMDVSETEEVQMKVPEPQPMKWQPGTLDYSGASNLAERLVRLARHTQDGVMDPSQMATRLVEDGQSTQRLASLGRLIGHIMRKHPEFRAIHRAECRWNESIPRQPAVQAKRTSSGESPSTASDSSRSISDPSSGEAAIGGRNGSTHRWSA